MQRLLLQPGPGQLLCLKQSILPSSFLCSANPTPPGPSVLMATAPTAGVRLELFVDATARSSKRAGCSCTPFSLSLESSELLISSSFRGAESCTLSITLVWPAPQLGPRNLKLALKNWKWDTTKGNTNVSELNPRSPTAKTASARSSASPKVVLPLPNLS